MYGGNSRFNNSVTVNNNSALKESISYEVDFDNDAMIVLVPVMDQWNTKLSFTYQIMGDVKTGLQLNWW